MEVPKGFETMSDEQLLKELVKIYESVEAAAYVLDVLRGRIKPAHPLS